MIVRHCLLADLVRVRRHVRRGRVRPRVDHEPANTLPALPLRHGRAIVKKSIVLDGDLKGRISGPLHREAVYATVEDRVVRKVKGPPA